MVYSPRLYLKDLFISLPLAGALLIQAVMWWYIISNIHPSAERFFLHYNVILGVNLVGEWWRLYLFPGFSFLILLVNYILSLYFYNTDKFLSRFLSFFTFFLQALILAAVILLIRINV